MSVSPADSEPRLSIMASEPGPQWPFIRRALCTLEVLLGLSAHVQMFAKSRNRNSPTFKRRACPPYQYHWRLTLLAQEITSGPPFPFGTTEIWAFVCSLEFSGVFLLPAFVTAQTIQKVRGGLCNRYQLATVDSWSCCADRGMGGGVEGGLPCILLALS